MSRILSLAQIQQDILDAVTSQYRVVLMAVFKRLSIKPEMMKFSKVDIAKGELIIEQPKKK